MANALFISFDNEENGCFLLELATKMLYNILKLLHVLSIIVWVGGMVYTLFFLRPSLGPLEPPQRVKLMHDVLGRFFKAVLVVSTVAVVSGLWMIGRVARETVQAGGAFTWPTTWIVMTALGLAMFAIFGHIRFALYKRLQRAVAASDWPTGGKALEQIRTWVTVNLGIGIAIIGVVFLVR
jgi:uncharacterized membrane protein